MRNKILGIAGRGVLGHPDGGQRCNHHLQLHSYGHKRPPERPRYRPATFHSTATSSRLAGALFTAKG